MGILLLVRDLAAPVDRHQDFTSVCIVFLLLILKKLKSEQHVHGRLSLQGIGLCVVLNQRQKSLELVLAYWLLAGQVLSFSLLLVFVEVLSELIDALLNLHKLLGRLVPFCLLQVL